MAQINSPVGPVVGVADTSLGNSRLFVDAPHTDGVIFCGPDDMSVSATTAPVLTRISTGRWAFQRTAAAAETLYFRATLDQILRTGEYQQFGDFGSGSQAQNFHTKGITIQGAFAALQIGVVALTSATLRIGRTVYSTVAGAPVQSDLLAATALGSLATNTSPIVQSVAVPVANQTYETNALGLVEVELAIVMANTGTIGLEMIGLNVGFNYN